MKKFVQEFREAARRSGYEEQLFLKEE